MRTLHFFLLPLVALAIGCGGKTADTTTTTDGGIDDRPPGNPTDSAALDDGIESPPDTAPPDTAPPPYDATPSPNEKLDLLFVIDNSMSMADKQNELARAIPKMIRDLTVGSGSSKTLLDVHIGVITSSIGSQGTSACAVELTNRANDDRAHLLPRTGEGSGTGFQLDSTGAVVTAACPAPVSASALTWAFDPSRPAQFHGAAGANAAGLATTCVVLSAKDNGCGYEQPLEAMYHFLVDPAPYDKAAVSCVFGVSGDACGNNKINVSGVDSPILAQRAAFLRPDSTVAIVMLTDENDASLKPAGLNWLPFGYGKGQMQRGWSGCANVPDDFEPETAAEFKLLHDTYNCFSCFESGSDPACSLPWASVPLNNDVDGRNLRAFHQVQRYGYNFLWGRQRYVDALTRSTVIGSDGKIGENPLFAGGRGPGNVLFAVIGGVPRSLVANSDGTTKTLTAADWDKIVGPIGKRDPHMIESIAPRAGVAKFAGDRSIDPVHGGDRDIADGDDLQYACIAPRAAATPGNDCEGSSPAAKNPLCAPDGSQPYFKAYPSLRALRVARDVNGYAASICETNLSNALDGVVRRLQPMIK